MALNNSIPFMGFELDARRRQQDQVDRQLDISQQNADTSVAQEQRIGAAAAREAALQREVQAAIGDVVGAQPGQVPKAALNKLRVLAPEIANKLSEEDRARMHELNVKDIGIFAQLGDIDPNGLTPEQQQHVARSIAQIRSEGGFQNEDTRDLYTPEGLLRRRAEVTAMALTNPNLSQKAKEAILAGHMPGSKGFNQFLAPRELVKIDNRQPGKLTPEQEAIRGSIGEQLSAVIENAATAPGALAEIQTARELLDSGLETGALSPLKLTLTRFSEALGLDLEELGFGGVTTDAGAAEAFNALGTRMALKMTEQTKGAVSDYEMRLFLSAVAQLSQTPEGNRTILEYMERVERRKLEAAELVENLSDQGKSATEINRALRKLGEKSIFSADELKTLTNMSEKAQKSTHNTAELDALVSEGMDMAQAKRLLELRKAQGG